MNNRVGNAVDKREDDRHFFSIRRKGESCKQMRISAFGVLVFSPFLHISAFVAGDVVMTLLLLFQRAYKEWGP